MSNTKTKTDAKRFASIILKCRTLNKMISTYYKRLKDRLYPDNCIRGYLNHCSSKTGRLTSDLQQIPGKKISNVKQMFISRYK